MFAESKPGTGETSAVERREILRLMLGVSDGSDAEQVEFDKIYGLVSSMLKADFGDGFEDMEVSISSGGGLMVLKDRSKKVVASFSMPNEARNVGVLRSVFGDIEEMVCVNIINGTYRDTDPSGSYVNFIDVWKNFTFKAVDELETYLSGNRGYYREVGEGGEEGAGGKLAHTLGPNHYDSKRRSGGSGRVLDSLPEGEPVRDSGRRDEGSDASRRFKDQLKLRERFSRLPEGGGRIVGRAVVRALRGSCVFSARACEAWASVTGRLCFQDRGEGSFSNRGKPLPISRDAVRGYLILGGLTSAAYLLSSDLGSKLVHEIPTNYQWAANVARYGLEAAMNPVVFIEEGIIRGALRVYSNFNPFQAREMASIANQWRYACLRTLGNFVLWAYAVRHYKSMDPKDLLGFRR